MCTREPYPSEFYGPTRLVTNQRLGANVGSAQGPTDLGKYLMHPPTREVFFDGETIHSWDLSAPWFEL